MLKNIKTTACPICGCSEIINEYVEVSNFIKPEIKTHGNDTRWEHREFLCGYRVEFQPNYSKEIRSKRSECFYDPVIITKKEKEKQEREDAVNILKANNISQGIINMLNCKSSPL
jgi:hypothetical protein